MIVVPGRIRQLKMNNMNIMVGVLAVYMRMRKRCHALQQCKQHQQGQTDHPVQVHAWNCNLKGCFIQSHLHFVVESALFILRIELLFQGHL